MKIGVVIPSFYPAVIYGGPIFSSLNTCKELARLGQDVKVSTTNTNMYERLEVPVNTWLTMDGFFVKYYNETIVDKFSFPLVINLWNDLRKADIVHVQAIFNSPTPIALLTAFMLKKPVLLSPRGVLGDWVMGQGNKFKKIWLNLLIRPFANRITWHATAEQERKEILFHFPRAVVHTVPNGIDVEAFAGERELDRLTYLKKYTGQDFTAQTRVIVSLGRLHAKKGFDLLIESMLSMPEDIVLVIGGQDEGEERKLRLLIDTLKLADRVFLAGEIKTTEKKQFLIHADVFALTSHNENFGNVYAEALACGIPIVASVHTPWSGIIEADCGAWVELNVPEIVKGLQHCFSLDDTVKKRARDFISAYSWASIAKSFISLFEQLKR